MNQWDFNTPPEILELVRKLDPRGIGLDPCSNRHSLVDARIAWHQDDCDAVAFETWFRLESGRSWRGRSWRGHGLVFMNPPHSMSPNNIEPWMKKAYDEFIVPSRYGEDEWDDQFVGLIPAKTDTAWFHECTAPFPVKCFLRGRPKFWLDGKPMPGPGKFASMLIYAGNKPNLFRTIFAPLGWIV